MCNLSLKFRVKLALQIKLKSDIFGTYYIFYFSHLLDIKLYFENSFIEMGERTVKILTTNRKKQERFNNLKRWRQEIKKEEKSFFKITIHTSRGGRHALQTSSRKKSLTTQILFFSLLSNNSFYHNEEHHWWSKRIWKIDQDISFFWPHRVTDYYFYPITTQSKVNFTNPSSKSWNAKVHVIWRKKSHSLFTNKTVPKLTIAHS